MNDAIEDAVTDAESELRLPAVGSQGFAHVRVVTMTNTEDGVAPIPLNAAGAPAGELAEPAFGEGTLAASAEHAEPAEHFVEPAA